MPSQPLLKRLNPLVEPTVYITALLTTLLDLRIDARPLSLLNTVFKTLADWVGEVLRGGTGAAPAGGGGGSGGAWASSQGWVS